MAPRTSAGTSFHTTDETTQWITVNDLCRRFSISSSKIYKLIKAGELESTTRCDIFPSRPELRAFCIPGCCGQLFEFECSSSR
jgi:predicted DNA-binding transcriptional regulator AlpA